MSERPFEDAGELINHLTSLAKENKWVFRGYSEQDQLFPNILRYGLEDMEYELLFEFERYGNQYINVNNPIDFMSYAQHFGLPTRLLDFTYNPFIALYFSLFSPKKDENCNSTDDGKYYYIRCSSIRENMLIKHIPYFNRGPYFELNSMARRSVDLFETINIIFGKTYNPTFMFETKDKFVKSFCTSIVFYWEKEYVDTLANMNKVQNRVILFVDPNQSNQRLVMQQGLFMFPYTLNAFEHLKILDSHSDIIKIHKSLREELLVYLDTLGINAFRIMPDLSSICEAIVRKTKDKQNSIRQAVQKTGG